MNEENVAIAEDDQIEGESEVPHKIFRQRKKQLYEAIRKQMEFYFSDANITKDRFLGKLINEDPHVDLSIFIRFNKIRCLTTNITDIAKALRNSEILSVTEDGTKIFRNTPVKEKENTDDCTIYVEQLPPDAQHDWVRDVFSKYGKVAYVSIPKYRNSGKIKGFAFVEFETPEEVNKTLEAFGAMGCRLSSQIAPEKLCSISTYETDEAQTESKPNDVSKKEKQEKGTEEENQAQDKCSKKKKKRKKEKQDHPDEKSFEETEIAENEGETESEKIPKKRKRKKTQESEIEEAESEEGAGQSQADIDTPPKKKKRKASDEPVVVEEKDEIGEDNSSTQKFQDTERYGEKKKRKRKSENIEDSNKAEIPNTEEMDSSGTPLVKKKGRKSLESNEEADSSEIQQDAAESHSEKKKQKRKSEDVDEVEEEKKSKSEWDEEVVEQVGEEEMVVEGEVVTVKKKNRKRKKKHKKEKPDADVSRLQILSKREWKRLRNKYLDLQKAKMKCLKQYFSRNRWNNNPQNRQHDQYQQTNNQTQEKEEDVDARSEKSKKNKPKFTYVPGVIVHATFDEPIIDLKKLRADAKALTDVAYVDAVKGARESFFRCASATAAEHLLANAPWQQLEILKGEAESQYWDKMMKDREEKIGNNIRVKQRGRDKILSKAERELGKHIRFDD